MFLPRTWLYLFILCCHSLIQSAIWKSVISDHIREWIFIFICDIVDLGSVSRTDKSNRSKWRWAKLFILHPFNRALQWIFCRHFSRSILSNGQMLASKFWLSTLFSEVVPKKPVNLLSLPQTSLESTVFTCTFWNIVPWGKYPFPSDIYLLSFSNTFLFFSKICYPCVSVWALNNAH